MKYYKLMMDEGQFPFCYMENVLDEHGVEISPAKFTNGIEYSGVRPKKVILKNDGRRMDINFAAFGVIVLSSRAKSVIEGLAQESAQNFPVSVDNGIEVYHILNICDLVDCLDEDNSSFVKWKKEDCRPDKLGKYRMVTDIRVRSGAIPNGRHIFRIENWEVVVVVSEDMKNLIQKSKLLGASFLLIG